jgi:iron complex transport system ATP-binding protein
VLICRALMAQFRVLILDEPCAGLDPVARAQFLAWLEQLGSQPSAPAIVLVTHHVEEILPCMKQALLLKEGRVIAAGPLHHALCSRTLSEAYGAEVRLCQKGASYTLEVQ